MHWVFIAILALGLWVEGVINDKQQQRLDTLELQVKLLNAKAGVKRGHE